MLLKILTLMTIVEVLLALYFLLGARLTINQSVLVWFALKVVAILTFIGWVIFIIMEGV